MSAPVVETHALAKSYRLAPVLRDVDLRVMPGRGAFVIGGNGAGKSTLLRILAGLEAPSDGRALIFGQDTRKLGTRYRRRIGMMGHQSFLYPDLTARENLEFYGELYSIADSRAAAAQWIERVGLGGFAEERVRAFSRGMEQRLAAARAMLADPTLLLLDEPFAALDAEGVSMVGTLIRNAIERGASVLATAHTAPEVDGVEFEVFELAQGRLAPFAPKEKEEIRLAGRLRSILGR